MSRTWEVQLFSSNPFPSRANGLLLLGYYMETRVFSRVIGKCLCGTAKGISWPGDGFPLLRRRHSFERRKENASRRELFNAQSTEVY